VKAVSTNEPEWQSECERLVMTDEPFELRDILTEEHHRFVNRFIGRFYPRYESKGRSAVVFVPTWRSKMGRTPN
jgi:hypothetical protein